MGSFVASGPAPMIDGWQPAETAPKDGTQILGLNNRGNFAVCFWREASGAHYAGWAHPFTTLEPSAFWNGACGSEMTHWQRLIWPPALCAQQFMYFAEVVLRGESACAPGLHHASVTEKCIMACNEKGADSE